MLVVVEVVVVAVIVFVVAALFVGRFDRMSDAPADAPFVEPLPRDAVSSADVRSARFGMSLRGYRMAEVDAVLARLADELEWRDEELARRDTEIVKLAGFARADHTGAGRAGGFSGGTGAGGGANRGPQAEGRAEAEAGAGVAGGTGSDDENPWPTP